MVSKSISKCTLEKFQGIFLSLQPRGPELDSNSNQKIFIQSAVGGAHTAKYDIIKSIEELKYYQDNIFIPTEY